MKHIMDTKAVQRYGFKEGKKAGIQESKYEIAKNLLKIGLSMEEIIEATGVTKEEFKKINN